MELLQHLNEVNDIRIYSVEEENFRTYGRILHGYDFSDVIDWLTKEGEMPAQNNIYKASVPELEGLAVFSQVRHLVYGDMPIQAGYCNGWNTTYNGFEYHKGSEINVAATDFMLVLGHRWDIKELAYDVSRAEVFFVPKGTAVEMYSTTLHLSPCRVSEAGFRDCVILPQGTNTPLCEKDHSEADEETKLLLMKNKWVIAHPERQQLISQGAYPGVTGINKELHY
jgi:hypothetical protein